MNWTGGARYRIKTQGERKLQKEFFDRKRLGAVKSVCNRTSRKKGVSQDLLALHTVSQAHSKGKQDETERKCIKRIDLDRFQSCTKRIEEVDMGPSSPTPTQSRLLLLESKSNMDNSISCVSTTETAKFTLQHESENAFFLKPETSSVHVWKTDKSDKGHLSKDLHTHSYRKHMHSSGTDHLQKSRQISETNHWTKTDLGETVSSYSEVSRGRYDQSFRFSKHGKKPQSNFDPFASEDFQITPLKKYSKNDSPVTQTHDNSRKRGCSQSLKEWSMFEAGESNSKHKRTSHSDTYLTSTPMKNLDKFKPPARTKDKFDFSAFGDSFSPIQKLSRHIPDVEDDFQYQPRPMITTPDTFKTRSVTPVLSNVSVASHTANQITTPEKPSKYLTFSFGNDSSQYEPETILSSSKVKDHDLHETSSLDSYLESVKRSNVFLQCSSEDPVVELFNAQDCPQVTPKQRNEKVHSGSNSSLLQYRQKFLQSKTELNSSDQSKDTERLNLPSSRLHVEKSEEFKNLFCPDKEPEIQYKACKKLLSEEDEKVDILRLYQAHKGTEARKSSLLQNCTVTSQSMLTTQKLEVTEQQQEQTDTKVRRLSGGEAAKYASSPKIGEDYPAHLNYQLTASENAKQTPKQEVPMNHSQETDEWHTPNDKRTFVGRKQTRGDSTSVANSHMEEVLQEMKELEQQDSVVQDEISEASCNNLNQMAACHAEPSTEMSEIDHFLESERKFWKSQGLDDVVLEGSVDKISFAGNETTDLNVKPGMVQDKITLSQTAKEAELNECLSESLKEQTGCKMSADSKSVGIQKQTDIMKFADTVEIQNQFYEQNRADVLNESKSESPVRGKIKTDNTIKVQSVSCSNNKNSVFDIQPDETKSPPVVQQAVVAGKFDDKASDSLSVSDSMNTAQPVTVEPRREIDDDKCNEHVEIDINLLSEESTTPNRLEVKDVSEQIVEDKVAFGIASVHQLTENQSIPADGSKETVFTPLDMGSRTEPCMEESKTFIAPEYMTSCDSILDSNVENECFSIISSENSKYFINLKSETHHTEVVTLQDPQISSGCNQGVQTDSVQCTDMASSPFAVHHSPTATKSVGIQCNFESCETIPAKNATTKIPMLGSLASNLLGSSYRRGISLVSFFNKNLGSSSSAMMSTYCKPPNDNSHKELSVFVSDSDGRSHQIEGANSAVSEPKFRPDVSKKED